MSSFTHFIHVFLFPPFLTPPPTSKCLHLETQSSASLRSTCPNHLSMPRLTILSSVLTSLRISTAFIGQVSLPYTSTLCTHALYIFSFTFNEAPLAVNNPLKSLTFPQAHLTLALDASSAPPPFPITSPK